MVGFVDADTREYDVFLQVHTLLFFVTMIQYHFQTYVCSAAVLPTLLGYPS
jgi:hypothetical protein